MTKLRKLLSRRLYMWACRLDESEWHEVTLLDKAGEEIAHFSCFGDWCAGGPTFDDLRCSCEEA